MKRILSIILVLTISWTTFFIVGSEAFASGLVETKPVPSTTVVNPTISDKQCMDLYTKVADYGLESYKLEVQASLAYFFTVLVNDKYGVSTSGNPRYKSSLDGSYSEYTYKDYSSAIPIRAKSSDGKYLNCFNPDYLHAYFDIMSYVAFCDYDSVGFMTEYYNLNGNGFTFIGQSLFKEPASSGDVLSTLSPYHIKYDFQTFSDYFNTLYSQYLLKQGQSQISVGYENNSSETYIYSPRVPSSTLVDYVNNNTTVIVPSIATTKRSWKYNPLSVSGYDAERDHTYFTFISDYNFFGINGLRDCYVLPFVTVNNVDYYSDSTFRLSYVYDDNNEVDKIRQEQFSSFNSDEAVASGTGYLTAGTYFPKCSYGYFDGIMMPSLCNKSFYTTRYYNESSITSGITFINDSGGTNSSFFPLFNNVSFISSSNSADIINDPMNGFFNPYGKFFSMNTNSDYHTGGTPLSVSDVPYDYGFLVASQPFEIGALSSYLDGSRIPSNSYVTISGDNIYDYSITDSNNGTTNNLGDFINNGYAWLNTGNGTQNNQGSGNGNGGGVGGNVTVGGQIDVGGSVDINVNVNGGGNGTSYDLDTDPMDDYLNDALTESSGIRRFLEEFFSFLPPELLTLLGILLTVVIIKAILRR